VKSPGLGNHSREALPVLLVGNGAASRPPCETRQPALQPLCLPAAFAAVEGKLSRRPSWHAKPGTAKRIGRGLPLKNPLLRRARVVGHCSCYGIGTSLRPRRRAPLGKDAPATGDVPVPAIGGVPNVVGKRDLPDGLGSALIWITNFARSEIPGRLHVFLRHS
jgi:hypothetical protein